MDMVRAALKQENHMQIHRDGFATTAEAARFLRLSKAMVHKLIHQGTMPSCRYGRAVRIPWVWLRTQAGE
jgi:excisionase family DNA binding protein